MEVLDNVNSLFGDDLRAELKPGSKLRIAASTFSIYAYEALKDELDQVEELEFIFTSPAFIAAKATDPLPKERRQFFIPNGSPTESALYGTEFEIHLRNQLTQRAIARECADWVRRKVRFRSNSTGDPMQQFAVVDGSAVYVSLQGFTTADLGYETSNAVSNVVTKLDDAPSAGKFWQLFSAIWNKPDQVSDVTDAVANHIDSVYTENSPARIYFLILYNVFAEFLADVTADVLPNELTGYQDSEIWQGLYNFQRDAAVGAINKLETYNGCILADSVGLGKTFTALAVIKYYELRNGKVMVLAPKKLEENWTTYTGNLTTNVFAADRLNYDVVAHTDLSRTSGRTGTGLPLNQINWGNYDLVVIDESHNFRNDKRTFDDRETRYERLLEHVIRRGVRTKVLMLSATPVNNHFTDLRNQLQLAYEGESEQLSRKLNLSTTIEEVFRRAQTAFNEWSKLEPEERSAQEIVDRLDFDFFELLDAVTIARSRKHIEAFYDTSDIGSFPTRRKPEAVRAPLTDLQGSPSFDDIFNDLTQIQMAVYAPLSYVFDSRLAKYAEIYDPHGDGSLGNLGQRNRELGIQRLMTTNLLKRLESSVEAFRITLGKLESTIRESLDDIATGGAAVATDTSATDLELDDDFDLAAPGVIGGKIKIDLADMDVERWENDLRSDLEIIASLRSRMNEITPDHDLKLRELHGRVMRKVEAPINAGNRKALIFSAFSDTAEYLFRELAPQFEAAGLHCGLVTGGQGAPKTTLGKTFAFQEVLTLFSPESKSRDKILPNEPRELDVLFATDCVSEGQNLQDCDYLVNYDIHWNPVRIIQRFGRIDRLGSKNDQIQLVNFWPDISLDEYINLKARVEDRMVIADMVGTGVDNPLEHGDSESAFRAEQLRKLQDEVVQLEDVKTGVSITDLGLNDFRMDLVSYIKEHGDLSRAPKGLHAVVPARPDLGLEPGAIFALRNVSVGPGLNRPNRLHPHYLVYVDDEGRLLADYAEVKRLLDLIRVSCRDEHEPLAQVCDIFNAATRDGAEMSHYSQLLSDAISSMAEVSDERAVDSLFTPGPTTALADRIAGLDDFELIAFLTIVDPEGSS